MNLARENLTNEWISKQYCDKFTLALKAIRVAKHHMDAGQDFTLNSLLEEVDTTNDQAEHQE